MNLLAQCNTSLFRMGRLRSDGIGMSEPDILGFCSVHGRRPGTVLLSIVTAVRSIGSHEQVISFCKSHALVATSSRAMKVPLAG